MGRADPACSGADMRALILSASCLALAGCLAAPPEDTQVEIAKVPARVEETREEPRKRFGLFRRNKGEAEKVVVETPAEPVALATVETEKPKKRLGLFRRKAEESEASQVSEVKPAEVTDRVPADEAPREIAAVTDEAVNEAEEKPRRRGLFGLGRKREADRPAVTELAAATPETEPVAEPEAAPKPTPAVLVAAAPATPLEQADEAPEALVKAGFWRRKDRGGVAPEGAALAGVSQAKRRPKGPEVDLPPGSVPVFGKIARVCGLKKRDLGTKVASYPERASKFSLYDSAPGSPGPRALYLTGFDDGCPRQMTGALALFGAVEVHDMLHYGQGASVTPSGDVAKAYQRVKSQVCKVGRRSPCGKRMSALSRDTVFVSVYPSFGEAKTWMNVLLHDGAVLAAQVESRAD
jgi:hypothetical protein